MGALKMVLIMLGLRKDDQNHRRLWNCLKQTTIKHTSFKCDRNKRKTVTQLTLMMFFHLQMGGLFSSKTQCSYAASHSPPPPPPVVLFLHGPPWWTALISACSAFDDLNYASQVVRREQSTAEPWCQNQIYIYIYSLCLHSPWLSKSDGKQ